MQERNLCSQDAREPNKLTMRTSQGLVTLCGDRSVINHGTFYWQVRKAQQKNKRTGNVEN